MRAGGGAANFEAGGSSSGCASSGAGAALASICAASASASAISFLAEFARPADELNERGETLCAILRIVVVVGARPDFAS